MTQLNQVYLNQPYKRYLCPTITNIDVKSVLKVTETLDGARRKTLS